MAKAAHPYCNVAMDTGVIPSLPPTTSLVQVQVLIRHGSRTKSAVAAVPAWDSEDEVEYDCSAHLLEGPDATMPGTLFRKMYTPGRNKLKGNCAVGQLVADGLEMCRASGRPRQSPRGCPRPLRPREPPRGSYPRNGREWGA